MEDVDDHTSWAEWFQLHGSRLLLCARQWTPSLADAEDVVQEGFVRYWKHQRHLGGDPFALVLTSVRRAALDRARSDARRAQREDHYGQEGSGDAPFFAVGAEADERTRAVEAALRQLPAEQREVLVLKLWGELTFAEIARELDLSPNTAASRYRYALGALKEHLTAADCHG
ncbi:RNA polymerase sigma factor [Opitutus terrae]|uniref:RNA polymerase, sigma-24 subunit, ECF subfamily n=1 Tax=Opitutus terrae (strain DSM 11246 / JCM 15787 / PB90-1) TaxID=452637 RepID=B1ZUQ2_OPITP|nr:sigma-70 family RNA polymerase sigma factor [Opitutus terrae]ACB74936.1 RNA polymerase, sigma-24 subunit, ECF subfamily [Opitutus terrae PB90-1]